jgi:hypothetical protein
LEKDLGYICGITWECEWVYMLRKFGLFCRSQHERFFDMAMKSQDGMLSYLHGDNGYPFLSWLMTPHKKKGEHHSILELLYNHKHKGGGQLLKMHLDSRNKFLEFFLRRHNCMLQLCQMSLISCSTIWYLWKEVDVEELMWVIQMEVGTQDVNDVVNGSNYMVMTMFASKAKYS